MPRNQADQLDKLVERWIEHCKSQGLAPATINNWRGYLRRFAGWAEDTPLRSLTLSDLDDFIADEYGRLSWSSKKAATLALRNFYEWASARGKAENIAAGLSFPKKPGRQRPTFYRPEQVVAVLDHIHGDSDRLAITLLARHGQRIGSVVALRWRDVDLDAAIVHYPSVKRTRAMSLPLDRETGRQLQAWRAMTRWAEPDDWVFVSKRGRAYPRCDDSLRDVIRQACLRCGVPYRGSHEFRRTCATTLLMAGAPLHVVSRDVLGHSSIQTTVESYAAIPDESVGVHLSKLPF